MERGRILDKYLTDDMPTKFYTEDPSKEVGFVEYPQPHQLAYTIGFIDVLVYTAR